MRAVALLLACLLAACTKPGATPRQVAVADSADQVQDSMTVFIIRDGARTAQVEADSAWIYQQRNVADMVNVKAIFFDKKTGEVVSTVTGKNGVYQIRDQSLELRGNVVAVSSKGKVLKTEHLVYDRAANMIRSDTAYTFTSPDGNGGGASFEADPDFKNVHTIRPTGVQKGKGFVLPGQKRDSGQ